jgi:hypothetical protein
MGFIAIEAAGGDGVSSDLKREELTGLIELNRRAKAGDQAALEELRQALDEHPQVWQTVGDLATVAHRTWLRLATSADPLTAEAVSRYIADLETRLTGDDASPLERLLVRQVVIAWLRLQHATLEAARETGENSLPKAAFNVRRVESAQRCFDLAVKTRNQVSRLKRKSVGRPRRDVEEDARSQSSTADVQRSEAGGDDSCTSERSSEPAVDSDAGQSPRSDVDPLQV